MGINSKSISVKGLTYQRVRKYVDTQGKTLAGFIDELINEALSGSTPQNRQEFGETGEAKDKVPQEEPHEVRRPEPQAPDTLSVREEQRRRHDRPLSRGTPASKPDEHAADDELDELRDYVPPIMHF